MKEDILEQLTEDYLRHLGYFTVTNVKFRPDPGHPEFEQKKDSSYSDIDVVGYCPGLTGAARVLAVSCKSWQGGFRPAYRIEKIDRGSRISGRQAWKAFRELVSPKWALAFREKVFELTGERQFTYVTAVTKLHGDKAVWEQHDPFLEVIEAPIQVTTLFEMLGELWEASTTTPASSDVGRTLQLIKAVGWAT